MKITFPYPVTLRIPDMQIVEGMLVCMNLREK